MLPTFVTTIFLSLILLCSIASLTFGFVASGEPSTKRATQSHILGDNMSTNESTTMLISTFCLTSMAAQLAMDAASREASSNGWQVTICISDAGGVPLLVRRSDGAFPASYEIAVGKARTAALFRKPTGILEDSVNVSSGHSRAALLSAPSFVLMRGGVPIVVNGQCVGAVGVSGVTPEEDERVAMTARDALLSKISLSKI